MKKFIMMVKAILLVDSLDDVESFRMGFDRSRARDGFENIRLFIDFMDTEDGRERKSKMYLFSIDRQQWEEICAYRNKGRRSKTVKVTIKDVTLLYLVNECIQKHKKDFRDKNVHWDKGDVTGIWRDSDGSVRVSYENGQWFHYWEENGRIVWD